MSIKLSSSLAGPLSRGHSLQFEPSRARPAIPEKHGFVRHWEMLRRRAGTIILFALAFGAIAYLVTLPLPKVYRAKGRIELQSPNENFLNLNSLNPVVSIGGNPTLLDTYVQTQIELFQSESLVEKVIDKLQLTERPEFNAPQGYAELARKVGLVRSKFTPARAAVVATVMNNLRARPARQTNIVEITYEANDPKMSAEVVNTLVNEYIEQEMQAGLKASQRTGRWLSDQLAELKRQLERAESELQNFSRQSDLFVISGNTNVAEESIKQVQAELSKAQADRMSKEALYHMATSRPADSLPAVLDNGPLRDYQLRVSELRRQRAELGSVLTPTNARIQRLDAQIKELEGIMLRERENVLSRIKNEYEASKVRENLLTTAYANRSGAINQQAGKLVRYNMLKREVESNRNLYEAMLRKVKESDIATAIRPSGVRVVDAARPPDSPYKPNRNLITALGLFGGMLFGLGFVIVREGTNRSFTEPGGVRSVLNVPELGVIPSAETSSIRSVAGTVTRPFVNALGFTSSHGQSSNGAAEMSPFGVDQISAIGDSFRAVVTSILFSAGSTPKVLVVTSPNPGEGKTTVISNLGAVLASIGHRVLLIDGDSRRPRLHEIFDVAQTYGLSDILHERMPDQAEIDRAIKPTQVHGLSVLTSGSRPEAILPVLLSSRTVHLFSRLREEFDTILIDTPPVLPVPDARILGRLADAVVIVLRAHKTTAEDAAACADRLAEDGTPILGTVLNDWRAHNSTYGYAYSRQTLYGKSPS